MEQQSPAPDLRQFYANKYELLLSESRVFPYEAGELQRPKKTTWYVSYYVFSVGQNKLVRRRRNVSGTTLKEKKESARNIINEINYLLKSGAHIDPVKEMRKDPNTYPLIVALDDYMKEKRATLKEQSVVTYEKWSKYLLEFLLERSYKTLPISGFTNQHAHELREYALDTQKMGNKTYNNYKAFVSGIFIYYKPVFKLTENPIANTLSNLPTKTSKHYAYDESQVREYKKQCESLGYPDLWFFVRLMYYTFCRPHEELRNMRVGDIKENHIVIYAENSKTNHRSVMIPTALERVFVEWGVRKCPPHFYLFSRDHKPGPVRVSRNFMYDMHVKVLLKMELYKMGYDLYGWKHTGVIALYKATKDLMLVKEQCGHSDISQTVQYLRDLGVFHYSNEINNFPAI